MRKIFLGFLILSSLIWLNPVAAQTASQFVISKPPTADPSTRLSLFTPAGKQQLATLIGANFPASTSQGMIPLLENLSEQDTRPYEARRNEAYNQLNNLYGGLQGDPNTAGSPKAILKEILDALAANKENAVVSFTVTPDLLEAYKTQYGNSAATEQVVIDYLDTLKSDPTAKKTALKNLFAIIGPFNKDATPITIPEQVKLLVSAIVSYAGVSDEEFVEALFDSQQSFPVYAALTSNNLSTGGNEPSFDLYINDTFKPLFLRSVEIIKHFYPDNTQNTYLSQMLYGKWREVVAQQPDNASFKRYFNMLIFPDEQALISGLLLNLPQLQISDLPQEDFSTAAKAQKLSSFLTTLIDTLKGSATENTSYDAYITRLQGLAERIAKSTPYMMPQQQEAPLSDKLSEEAVQFIKTKIITENLLAEKVSPALNEKLKLYVGSFTSDTPYTFPLVGETNRAATLYLTYVALLRAVPAADIPANIEKTLIYAVFKDFLEEQTKGRPFLLKKDKVDDFAQKAADWAKDIVSAYKEIQDVPQTFTPALLISPLYSLIVKMVDMPGSKIDAVTDDELDAKSDSILADMRKIDQAISAVITEQNTIDAAKEVPVVPGPSATLSQLAHDYLHKRVVLENILDDAYRNGADPVSENMKFHLKNLTNKIHTLKKPFAFPEKDPLFSPAQLVLLMSALAGSEEMFKNVPTNLKPEPIKKEIQNTLLFSTFSDEGLIEPGQAKTFNIPEGKGQSFADKAALLLTETFNQFEIVEGKQNQDNLLDYEKLVAAFLTIAEDAVEMTDDNKRKLQAALSQALVDQRLKNARPIYAFFKAKPQLDAVDAAANAGLITTEIRDYYKSFANGLSMQVGISFPTIEPDGISTAHLAMAYVLLVVSDVFANNAHTEINLEIQKMIVTTAFSEDGLIEEKAKSPGKSYSIPEGKEKAFEARAKALLEAIYLISEQSQAVETKPTQVQIGTIIEKLIEAIVELTAAEKEKVEEVIEATEAAPFEEQVGDDRITVDNHLNNPAQLAFEKALKDRQYEGVAGKRNDTLIEALKLAIDIYAVEGSPEQPINKLLSAFNTDEKLKTEFQDHTIAWATTGIPLVDEFNTIEKATKRCVDKIAETTLESGYELENVFKKPRDQYGVYATTRTDQTPETTRKKVYCGGLLVKKK